MATYGLLIRDPVTKNVLFDSRTSTMISRVVGFVIVSPSSRTATVSLPTDGTLFYFFIPIDSGASIGSGMPQVTKSGLTVTATLPATTPYTYQVGVGVY